MIINFVSNFANGYVGEVSDATHIARELEALGHTVRRIPQDEWREYVIDGKDYPNVPQDLTSDINLITKWHHFYDGSFIRHLKERSGAPVFYWVWDYMQSEDWHLAMVNESDLYLGNDVRNGTYAGLINSYYFPFDCIDGDIEVAGYKKDGNQFLPVKKKYDVTFFGSWIGQGDRQGWLKAINKTNPIRAYSWNPLDWPLDFDVYPAIYGDEFARAVIESKVVLGFSVEPNCWGYWSNRVGKVMACKGFLLQQYAPGMELFLRDGCEYFSSIEEAREKIDHYIIADFEREKIAKRGCEIARERFTSKARVKDLEILIERYLKGHEWKI